MAICREKYPPFVFRVTISVKRDPLPCWLVEAEWQPQNVWPGDNAGWDAELGRIAMNISRKSDERGTPIHPGEFLREDFLVPLGLSANALAIALRVPVTRISEIVRERRGITADTALRLARYFGTTPDFWMMRQMAYDLALARRESIARIKMEIRPAPRREAAERKTRQFA